MKINPRASCRRLLVAPLALFASLVVQGDSWGAIDFTPVPGEREVEGIVFKQLLFSEKGQKITYRQPSGWRFSGATNTISLSPADLAMAQADILQTPLPAAQPIDPAASEQLKDRALKSIPPGSEQVAVLGEEQNAVRILGKDSYGVTIKYSQHGQSFTCNVLYANLDDAQLRMKVTARTEDFEKVFRAFRGSLFTLQRL